MVSQKTLRNREASRRYYQKNKEYYRNKKKENLNRKILLVNKIKNVPCMDCNNMFPPMCMDFDHRNSEDKVESISNMVRSYIGLEKLLREIAKCDIVCANCHRIRTFQRIQTNNEKTIFMKNIYVHLPKEDTMTR